MARYKITHRGGFVSPFKGSFKELVAKVNDFNLSEQSFQVISYEEINFCKKEKLIANNNEDEFGRMAKNIYYSAIENGSLVIGE